MLLLEYLFPPICHVCHNELAVDNLLCGHCSEQLKDLPGPRCFSCGFTNDTVLDVCQQCLSEDRLWDRGFTASRFKGIVRKMIHMFKYSGETPVAEVLASMMSKELIGIDVDCVTAVPSHWFKKMYRGYNQAEILAETVSRRIDSPYIELLKRVRWTKPQAGLGKSARSNNIKQVFSVQKKEFIEGRTILLVDDVLTTGSTLNACTKELKAAGAAKVFVVTAARG